MRNYYLIQYIILIGCILLLSSGCQEQAQISEAQKLPSQTDKPKAIKPDPNQPAPEIVFEQTVLDFGKIGPGVKASGQFNFENAGEGVLEITKVSQCCGVVTSLDKTQYVPGESGVLDVNFTGSAQVGQFLKNPIVHSNDPVRPTFPLTVKAEIVQIVVWEPDRLRLFLDEENADCPKLTVRSLDNKPFSITELRSTGNCITAEIDPTVEAAEFVLDLRADVEKLKTNTRGSIVLGTTHPNGDYAEVLFDVLPEFSLSPSLIVVFNAEPQQAILRKVLVANLRKEDFEIEATSSKENIISVKNKTRIDNGYQLEVEITPPLNPDDSKRFTDVFTINIKGGPSLSVTCNVYYNTRSGASSKSVTQQ